MDYAGAGILKLAAYQPMRGISKLAAPPLTDMPSGLKLLTQKTADHHKKAVNVFKPIMQLLKQQKYKNLQPSFEKGRAWSEFVTNPANAETIRNARVYPTGYNQLNPLAHVFKPKALPASQNIQTYGIPDKYKQVTDYILDGSKFVEHPNGLWLPTTAKSVEMVAPEMLLTIRRLGSKTLGDFIPKTKRI